MEKLCISYGLANYHLLYIMGTESHVVLLRQILARCVWDSHSVQIRSTDALCTGLGGRGGHFSHNFGITAHYRPKFSEYLS